MSSGGLPRRALVIIPAFREEASVGSVVAQIFALSIQSPLAESPLAESPQDESLLDQSALAESPNGAPPPYKSFGEMDLTVLVVNDGSPDDTANQARMAGAIVASLPVNLGVGAALQTGFRYAVRNGFQTVVTIDADGQHPVAAIPKLLAVPDAALVIGSRFVPGSVAPEWVSSTRSAAMGILRRRLKTRTGVVLHDPTSGFRVIREPLLSLFAKDFPATYLGDTFEAHLSAAAILGSSGIAEVSVPMKQRLTGKPSSAGIRNIAYFARALLTTTRPVWKPLGAGFATDSSNSFEHSLLGNDKSANHFFVEKSRPKKSSSEAHLPPPELGHSTHA